MPPATACCRCSCSTPRCGGRPARPAGAYLAASLRALDAVAAAAPGGTAVACVRGDPVRQVRPGRRARSAPAGCTSPPTTAPTATGATRDVEQALAEARHRAGPHRVAVRRGAGPGDQRLGRPLQGVHAVLPGLGRARLARPGRRARAASVAGPRRDRRAPRPAACPTGCELPEAGEARGAAALAGVPRRGLGGLRRRRATGPTSTRTSPDVGAPEVGRDPSAHDAGRPAGRTGAGRGDATAGSWPGGSSTPTCCSHRPDTAREYLRPEFAAMAYDEPGDQLEAWQRGPHRLPDRRRRDAAAARHRLDAQPGADDRRQLPGQGPAPRVAARRAALHAAGSSTATSPPTSTAGSGSAGCGTDAAPYFRVFNPTTQGAKFDPRRRLRARAGCPSSPTSTRSTSTSRGRRPTASPAGYPAPIVDHGAERREALARRHRIRKRA